MALAPNDMGGTEHGNAMRLVTAHQAGDSAAFTEIVRTHYPTLLACARRRLTNPQDAEDAVQEAFLRAYRRLGSFGHEGDWRLGAWLNTILSNVCTDILIRRRPTAPFDERDDARADDRPDAVDLVSDTAVHDAIVRAVATLPQSQRNAFLLRMVDDRPYDEVAATLGITEDNARARVARARNALQRTLSRSEALTGMLAAAPLFLAGSLRSTLRRVFSPSASSSAHATAAALATNASTATAEAATVSSGPVGSSMQLLGQLASTPVAQVAIAASTNASGRGSVVLGVVASLAAAGGLSVPAVAAATGPAPSAAQSAPHLVSTTAPPPASNAPSTSPAAPSVPAAQAPAAATSSTTPAHVASAPPAPAWVALAASATVEGRASVASDASSGGTSSPVQGTATSGGSSTTPPPTAGSGSPPSATAPSPGVTTPGTAGGGSATLPAETCTAVTGFPTITAPSSVPPLVSDALVAVVTTGTQALSSTGAAPAFQTTGSMTSMSGPALAVTVKVGTCLAASGSILAVDMTGTTGAAVQLVGSLVSAPATATPTSAQPKAATDYLFRGSVTQIAGHGLPGGRLPWNLSPSFVAEVQVQPGGVGSLQVVFLRAMSGGPATLATGTATSGSVATSHTGMATTPETTGTGAPTGTAVTVTRIDTTGTTTTTTTAPASATASS